MRFRANLSDVNTFSRIAQSVNKVSNRCILSLGREDFHIICVGDPEGLQIWSKLSTNAFFEDFRIESNNNNQIFIEIATETLLKALRSGLNAMDITIRLAKKNKTPLLSFNIVNASHNGAKLVVVQDVLIRILKPTEMERIKEPLCPAPDVHITLPPLLKLRTVCDRMRSLADVVHVSANRQGKFRLQIQEDEITMETCWRNLQHPDMDVEPNELEAPEDLFRGVALELKSVGRFLGSYVVETTTIACICKDHCAIFYVYIGDIKKGKGVMSVSRIGADERE
ncbi:Checkpoint protein hus1 [Tilletia horrida]|nr:Checkpoint protein hus1 [Tilletia horrida]